MTRAAQESLAGPRSAAVNPLELLWSAFLALGMVFSLTPQLRWGSADRRSRRTFDLALASAGLVDFAYRLSRRDVRAASGISGILDDIRGRPVSGRDQRRSDRRFLTTGRSSFTISWPICCLVVLMGVLFALPGARRRLHRDPVDHGALRRALSRAPDGQRVGGVHLEQHRSLVLGPIAGMVRQSQPVRPPCHGHRLPCARTRRERCRAHTQTRGVRLRHYRPGHRLAWTEQCVFRRGFRDIRLVWTPEGRESGDMVPNAEVFPESRFGAAALASLVFISCLFAPAIESLVEARGGPLSLIARKGEDQDSEAKLRLYLWKEAIERGLNSWMLGFGPGPASRYSEQPHRKPPQRRRAHQSISPESGLGSQLRSSQYVS